MAKHEMNEPATKHAEVDARYRPDEKIEAPANARLRGSWQKLRSTRKAKHRKSRRK